MKKSFITVAFAVIALKTIAQVSSNSELKNMINQSFTYYPRVKEAENQVDISQKRLDLTRTNFPVVNANATYDYVQPKITLPLEVDGEKRNFQFFPVNNYNGNISASYTVLDFGRLKAAVDKSKSDLKFSVDNLVNVQMQLASQISTIYYNIIYLKKAIAVEDTVLNYLNSNKNIADVRLKNGDAIKLDVLNLQSQVDGEVNRKSDLLNNLQKQITLLEYASGNTEVSGNTFDFNLPIQTLQDAFSNASAAAPDFILAQDRVAQAKADLNITRLNDKPLLNVSTSAGVKNGYVPTVNDPRLNFSAGLSLKIPIYNAKTKKQLDVAEAQVKQTQLAQQTLNNEYQKNIQQALTDIKTNADKIKNMRSQIETAESARQIASSRYLNGIGLNTDITYAAVNLQRTLLTQLQYEYQLCLAKIEYARLTGVKYW